MTRGRMAASIGLGFALLITPPLGSENAVEIAVQPAVAMAPAALRVVVQVEPRQENRELIVAADSGDFYRASYIQLDGERAALAHALMLRGLPAGHYTITVRLRGSDGERAADSRAVDVLERSGSAARPPRSIARRSGR